MTVNLYAALSRLRHRSNIQRVLWVDAVCINQNDASEKEQQIQIMAKIFALANRVVIWLGDATEDSDQALEEIRLAGGRAKFSNSSSLEMPQQAILTLLNRPWFRRVWVKV